MNATSDITVEATRRGADRRHWLGLALLAVALIVLWQVPWLGWLAYPFRLFGTFVHELSHGLAAIATGGAFQRFSVQPDLSGLAWSAGGTRVVVTSAGYLGSAIFGGVLIALHARWLTARVLLAGMAVVLALQLILDGYNSLFTVFRLARTGDTASDAQTMAQLTWLPASLWAVLWMLVSTAVLFGVLRFAMRGR